MKTIKNICLLAAIMAVFVGSVSAAWGGNTERRVGAIGTVFAGSAGLIVGGLLKQQIEQLSKVLESKQAELSELDDESEEYALVEAEIAELEAKKKKIRLGMIISYVAGAPLWALGMIQLHRK